MTDYISRETLLDNINWHMDKFPECAECLEIALKGMVREIPAVDVVPVKHGKWEQITLPPKTGYEAKQCGVCKCSFWDLADWNYCPNCGARMEGES